MKKIIIFLFICMLTIFCFFNINKLKEASNETSKVDNHSSDEIIKVMEPVYLDYVQEIHLNPNEYIGKTVEIEGMFTSEYDEIENKTFYYIYRLSDSVHYHDDEKEVEEVMSGFEFTYDDEIPKENDWIKVVGVIENENSNIVIKATSVITMKNRGLEKVTSFY